MNRMRRFFPALLLLATASLASAQTALPSGGAHYRITQNSKQLGDAQFSTAPVKGGETLTSSGAIKLDNFSYSFHNSATVDGEANLVRDELTGSVHGAKASGNDIRFSTVADSTGRSFQITVNAGAQPTANTVDRHRNLVLAPDLDPAAYTLMAHFALAQPQTAWVLIPKENGILVPAEYTRVAGLTGTLDGHSVPVDHAVVALGGENSLIIELFYTPDGALMEADLNAQNFRVERDGWKLENRPKPVAPPPGQAPPPPQGESDTPQQQPPAAPPQR